MKQLYSSKTKFLVFGLAVAVVALVFGSRLFSRASGKTEGTIAVSGRIEGDDAAVAAKLPGRIREINVREGDQVVKGQVIAVLEDDQVKAREEQARSAVTTAEAGVNAAKRQVLVLNEELRRGELSVEQAGLDAEGRVAQAQAQVAAAEAELGRAEAAYKFAVYDENLYAGLVASGDEAERKLKEAQTTRETQAAAVDAARKHVEAARGALRAVSASKSNRPILSAQTAGVRERIAQAEIEVAAAQAELERARARLVETQADRADLTITAPFDATVLTRAAEPGEVVASGTPVVTLVNLNDVYLRGFVPQGESGLVRVGQKARVFLDSNPDAPIEAVVDRVDPEASFTPENTYFRDDRVKQVVGVKLRLRSGFGFAKPGMSADGEIVLSGNQ